MPAGVKRVLEKSEFLESAVGSTRFRGLQLTCYGPLKTVLLVLPVTEHFPM